MSKILFIEVFGYFGVLLLQGFWRARGELTEQRFAVYQVAVLTLIMITAGLEAYLASPNREPLGLLTLCLGTVAFALVGYPVARWIFRQLSSPK